MRTFIFCLTFALSALLFGSGRHIKQADAKIDAGAVWNPTLDNMGTILKACGLLRGDELYSCLLDEMQSLKASKQAVEFAGQLGGRGFMKSFSPMGVVDAAIVYYPFDNENHEGCIIINGTPSLVNTDNFDLLDIKNLEADPGYINLEKNYPHLSLFTGDRSGTYYPYKINLPDGGERVVVNYSLRDGCSSCELTGYAEFGFDFDSLGKFIGTKFLTIKKTVTLDSAIIKDSSPANVFNDPSQTIEVQPGQNFSIALQSNHSAGFKWELAEPLNEKVVTLLGSNFLIPNETLPNAAGKEVWNFKAAGKGAAIIKFNYVRDWQGSEKAFSQMVFTLNVE